MAEWLGLAGPKNRPMRGLKAGGASRPARFAQRSALAAWNFSWENWSGQAWVNTHFKASFCDQKRWKYHKTAWNIWGLGLKRKSDLCRWRGQEMSSWKSWKYDAPPPNRSLFCQVLVFHFGFSVSFNPGSQPKMCSGVTPVYFETRKKLFCFQDVWIKPVKEIQSEFMASQRLTLWSQW